MPVDLTGLFAWFPRHPGERKYRYNLRTSRIIYEEGTYPYPEFRLLFFGRNSASVIMQPLYLYLVEHLLASWRAWRLVFRRAPKVRRSWLRSGKEGTNVAILPIDYKLSAQKNNPRYHIDITSGCIQERKYTGHTNVVNPKLAMGSS